MLSQDVRLFVRLSVTRRYAVETAKHRPILIFSQFFSNQTIAVFRQDPLVGSSNAGEYEKIAIFD